jgi:hypothetical protein
MKSKFEVFFKDTSDSDHLVVRIEFDRRVLCEINKEKGDENIEVVFDPDYFISERKEEIRTPLSEFLAILNEAIEELKRCP